MDHNSMATTVYLLHHSLDTRILETTFCYTCYTKPPLCFDSELSEAAQVIMSTSLPPCILLLLPQGLKQACDHTFKEGGAAGVGGKVGLAD